MHDPARVFESQTFIGSSSEGLVVANAIKANLSATTECQIWTEGVFLPGRTYIETLETLLDRVDYAILVATPDDTLNKRNVERFSMRDNVLLELGLFMAKLGRTRTYLVSPRDMPIHIPSDLLGLTTVDYVSPATPDEAVQYLSDPCDKIRHAMQVAETDVSLAMKRVIVKRLLTLANKLQGIVVTLQSESLRSLMDRSEFERIRSESAVNVEQMAIEYEEDAERLGVSDEAASLISSVVDAVTDIPFPEETEVTEREVIGGIFSQLAGGRSAKDRVSERFEKLTARYEGWWKQHSPRISGALNSFQGALIARM